MPCRSDLEFGIAKAEGVTPGYTRKSLSRDTFNHYGAMQPRAIPQRTSTLIIGGGPAGIVSLKYVQEYGPRFGLQNEGDNEPPVLVEMESEIGGTFK